MAPGNGPVSGFCCRALPDCRGFVSRRLTKMGSFRQGVTSCRGFVSAATFASFGEPPRHYRLQWVRFAQAHENGFVSSRRYILPWVRFGYDFRFVRGTAEALQIAVGSFRAGISNWVRFVKALHLAVGSFRQRNSVRSGKPRGVTDCHWVPFVGTYFANAAPGHEARRIRPVISCRFDGNNPGWLGLRYSEAPVRWPRLFRGVEDSAPATRTRSRRRSREGIPGLILSLVGLPGNVPQTILSSQHCRAIHPSRVRTRHSLFNLPRPPFGPWIEVDPEPGCVAGNSFGLAERLAGAERIAGKRRKGGHSTFSERKRGTFYFFRHRKKRGTFYFFVTLGDSGKQGKEKVECPLFPFPAFFTFVTTPGVEPTNNLAEQAIRFVVIDRHITQGTRSETGRRWSERIWTTIATCAGQGRSVYGYMKECVGNWFEGQPSPSLLPSATSA